MNSNLPPGATNHPNAPWNQKEMYCRICESKSIGEIVDQYLAEHPDCTDWDNAYEKLEEDEVIGLCRQCYWDEMGEYDDD